MSTTGLHAIVQGRVQRVGFRMFVWREATRLGLGGWTRNLRDGSVEVMASGDAASLDRLLERLRTGPPGARVDSVQVDRPADATRYDEFDIRA